MNNDANYHGGTYKRHKNSKLSYNTRQLILSRFADGLTASQAMREFQVSYKTAWRLKQIHDGRPVWKQKRHPLPNLNTGTANDGR